MEGIALLSTRRPLVDRGRYSIANQEGAATGDSGCVRAPVAGVN